MENIQKTLPFIFYYKGNYAEGPTVSIAAIIENYIRKSGETEFLKKMVFILVEALQNIERYSNEDSASSDFSMVFSNEKHHLIITQNTIEKSKTEDLKKRLDALQGVSSKELKELYIKTLTEGKKTEKGSGLGLIEIARKSNNHFTYSFDELNDSQMTYYLCFAIPVKKEFENSEPDFTIARKLVNELTHDNQLYKGKLFYKGEFSNVFLKPLLEMLKIMKSKAGSLNKKTHHILIELIQNVSKHSTSANQSIPSISIAWTEKQMEITSHNPISKNHEFISLKKQIE